MTTIFELVEMMDGPSGRAKSKVPSATWVRKSGGAVLDSAVLSDGVEITAYQSGFILYRDTVDVCTDERYTEKEKEQTNETGSMALLRECGGHDISTFVQ